MVYEVAEEFVLLQAIYNYLVHPHLTQQQCPSPPTTASTQQNNKILERTFYAYTQPLLWQFLFSFRLRLGALFSLVVLAFFLEEHQDSCHPTVALSQPLYLKICMHM